MLEVAIGIRCKRKIKKIGKDFNGNYKIDKL